MNNIRTYNNIFKQITKLFEGQSNMILSQLSVFLLFEFIGE